jgi:DNA-binding Lrp family transcriptional regulator
VTYEDLSVTLDLNPGLVRTRMRELLDEGLIEPMGEVVELAAAHRRLNAKGR